jgi:hypothetical protein
MASLQQSGGRSTAAPLLLLLSPAASNNPDAGVAPPTVYEPAGNENGNSKCPWAGRRLFYEKDEHDGDDTNG